MSGPGIRPRNNKPAAGAGKQGPPRALRVMSEDGVARAAAPSIIMPRAKTELSELLAGDALLCVRRRPPASPSRDAELAARPRAESPAALAGQQGPRASSPARIADEDLARLIDAWPSLPGNIRAAILALVRTTASGET
jgi:hypothetical protein